MQIRLCTKFFRTFKLLRISFQAAPLQTIVIAKSIQSAPIKLEISMLAATTSSTAGVLRKSGLQ